MDYAMHNIPEWACEGKNTCRIFLNANTIADIATIDGRFIPDHIRTIKSPTRNTTLQFPFQSRPAKQDIEQWRYFIDWISHNKRLHIELGNRV